MSERVVYGECSNSIFSEIKPDTKQRVGLHFRFVFSCRITPLLVIPSVMYSTRHVCIVRPLFTIENLDLVSLYSCNISFSCTVPFLDSFDSKSYREHRDHTRSELSIIHKYFLIAYTSAPKS